MVNLCFHFQAMCNTPTYCDLGKAAKDVFNKGYGKYTMVNFMSSQGLW